MHYNTETLLFVILTIIFCVCDKIATKVYCTFWLKLTVRTFCTTSQVKLCILINLQFFLWKYKMEPQNYYKFSFTSLLSVEWNTVWGRLSGGKISVNTKALGKSSCGSESIRTSSIQGIIAYKYCSAIFCLPVCQTLSPVLCRHNYSEWFTKIESVVYRALVTSNNMQDQ